jgi:hypothetical protein
MTQLVHQEQHDRKISIFPNLMKQSTIHRRHEARLARTYALQQDPRPAFLRVLSGLPGFRIIVPPYESQTINLPKVAAASASASAVQAPIGVYSEDTLFTTTMENAIATKNSMTQPSTSTSFQTAAQAMLATAICGGTAEFIFGSRATAHPFGGTQVYSPFVAQQGDSMAVQFTKKQLFPPKTAISSRQIAVAASSVSLLFGTKVLLDQQQLLQGSSSSSSSDYSNSLLSSATAGLVMGGVQHVFATKPTPTLRIPSSPPPQPSSLLVMYFGKHMVAATLYFGTYDQVRGTSLLGCHHHCALAGALAGSVHATVLTYSHGMMRWIPAMMRAAPTHALIFTGYETMKYHSLLLEQERQ